MSSAEEGTAMETDQSEGEETEDYGNFSMVTELIEYNTEEDYMVQEQTFDSK